MSHTLAYCETETLKFANLHLDGCEPNWLIDKALLGPLVHERFSSRIQVDRLAMHQAASAA